MAVDMLVHSDEEGFFGVSQAIRREYRELHNLQNSDEIKGIKDELKREQAATVRVVEPKGKRRRRGVVQFLSKRSNVTDL